MKVATLADNMTMVRFLFVGLSNFAVSFGVYLIGIRLLPDNGTRALIAQALSYSVGIAWSFVWNKVFTFKSGGRSATELPRFLALQFSMLALSSLSLWLLVDQSRLHPTLSWIGVMGMVTVANFLGMRLWVFKT